MATELVNSNHHDATQALWLLAETDDTSKLESLLADGADINAGNKYGTTALMRAASKGRVRMVEALLKQGADPNVSRGDEFTAFLLAVFFGHQDAVRILFEHGAKIDALSRSGTSARMWAMSRLYYDLVDYVDKLAMLGQSSTAEVAVEESTSYVVDEISTDKMKEVETTAAEELEKREAVEVPGQGDADKEEPVVEVVAETPVRRQATRRAGAYSVAAVLILFAVYGGVALRRQQATQGPLPATSASNTPSQLETKSVAVNSIGTVTPGDQPRDLRRNEDNQAKAAVVTQSPQEISTLKREKRKPTRISSSGISLADRKSQANLKEAESLAVTVSMETPKSQTPVQNVTRNRATTNRPPTATTQLLSSPNTSTPKGREIRWP